MLWLFLNNHNALWHVKICHNAKVVSRLWPQRVRRWKPWKLRWRHWGFRTESHLQPLCKEESNQHWVRRCKIWSGTKAQKMVSLSNSRLPAVDIGTNVVIRVPELDRGRLAPRNVPAVVIDVNTSGLYLLGTKEGLLEQLYACSEFIAADNNFIEAHDVPSSSLSFRSASTMTSGSNQGFVSCHCKSYCIDNKCKCRSKNMKCNSKCHFNSSHKNKWASPLFFIRPTLNAFLINKLLNLLNISFKRHFALWQFLSCHNALWLFNNSHNKQFRVVAVSLMPQRVVVVFSTQWAFSIFERNI